MPRAAVLCTCVGLVIIPVEGNSTKINCGSRALFTFCSVVSTLCILPDLTLNKRGDVRVTYH
jgi:hypothetical protein